LDGWRRGVDADVVDLECVREHGVASGGPPRDAGAQVPLLRMMYMGVFEIRLAAVPSISWTICPST